VEELLWAREDVVAELEELSGICPV